MNRMKLRQQLEDDLRLLQKPWAPFMGAAFIHFIILTGQLSRYLDGVDSLLTWPIMFCAMGGIWDNFRLYKASKHGESCLSQAVTNMRYIFRMVFVPMLFIPLSYMIGEMTSLWFLSVVGRIAAVAFIVHGFNEFVIQVAGHYVTVSEYGVLRHTVDPKMRNTSIRLPLLIVGAGGIIAGLAALKTREAHLTILLQVVCLLGRFSAPVYPRYAIAISRVLEAMFLYTIVHIQLMVY